MEVAFAGVDPVRLRLLGSTSVRLAVDEVPPQMVLVHDWHPDGDWGVADPMSSSACQLSTTLPWVKFPTDVPVRVRHQGVAWELPTC